MSDGVFLVKARALSKKKIVRDGVWRFGCGLCLASLLWACAGSDSEETTVPDLKNRTVSGSIKSITGSQSEMNQWVVALVERESGISYAASLNAVGYYSIEGVDLDKVYTMVLMDPQFRFSAVLSHGGLEAGTIRQYFKTSAPLFPTLVHNGPIMSFTDAENLQWQDGKANDGDNDLIPDGREVTGLRLLDKDSDRDGVDNSIDPDIDGDGVANWFDADDDNDGILDAFDADANGDDTPDLNQTLGDQYFPSKIDYIAVQVMQDVLDDQSLGTTLTITAKVDPESEVKEIRLRAPSSLMEGAKAQTFNIDRGELSEVAWDGVLVDDGLNEDGTAKDMTFARRVRLATGKVPRASQVIFVQREFEEGESVRRMEFPYTFPNMVTGAISGSYVAASRQVTLTGAPFGGITEFRWSVHVFDASGYKVFSSEPVPGTISSYTIPSSTLEAGKSYTARIVATALERIPSFPSWVIRSASFNL